MKKILVFSFLISLINFDYVNSAINVEKIVHDFQELYPDRKDIETLNKSVRKIEKQLQEEFSKIDSVQAKQVVERKLKELKETHPELFVEIEEISLNPWRDSIISAVMCIGFWFVYAIFHVALGHSYKTLAETVQNLTEDSWFSRFLDVLLVLSAILTPLLPAKDVVTFNDFNFKRCGKIIVLTEAFIAVLIRISNLVISRPESILLAGIFVSILMPFFAAIYVSYIRVLKHKAANKKSDHFIEIYLENYISDGEGSGGL